MSTPDILHYSRTGHPQCTPFRLAVSVKSRHKICSIALRHSHGALSILAQDGPLAVGINAFIVTHTISIEYAACSRYLSACIEVRLVDALPIE